MLENLWLIAYITLVLVAFCSMAASLYYLFRMYLEIESRKRQLANFIPFLIGVAPGFLTPTGQVFRNKFLKLFMVAAGCGGLALIVLLLHDSV